MQYEIINNKKNARSLFDRNLFIFYLFYLIFIQAHPIKQSLFKWSPDIWMRNMCFFLLGLTVQRDS